MAAIKNDRDNALQITPVRLVSVASNYISIISDYTYFNVTNGIASPTTIRVTALLNGQLIGVPTFSVVSGASTITQQTLNGNRVAFLNYSDLTGDAAVIRATLVYLGVTYTADITVGGQVLKPSTPTGFALQTYGRDLKLTWNKNTDADIAGYEVRTTTTGWGDNLYVYRGDTNSCIVAPGSAGVSTTWYIKAYDTSGLYSTNYATTAPYTLTVPNIADILFEYADTSLTNATITLRWAPVSPPFGLKEYQVTYFSESLQSNVTLVVRDNMIILPADWVGNKTFTVVTVDNLNNPSSGYSESIAKNLPNPVTNIKAVPIDNNVQLSWTMPAKTSLPISHAVIKRSGPTGTWANATLVGTKAGEFTTIQELVKGSYVYWVAAVDTDNNESTPVSVPAFVQQPPDFIFNATFNSTFNTVANSSVVTKTNAVVENGALVFPVNATETWQQHFVNNSYTTPSSQISAKYPVYIQPGTSTALYEEIFDYGKGAALILGSSNITVAISGQDVIGVTNIGVSISTSADGITYSAATAGFVAFATNFRYIKVTITAARGTGDGVTNIGSVYKMNALTVRLDTKLKTDSGTVLTSSTDTDGGGGTIVNFNTEFVDISAITLTASGTVPRNCVYSFMDGIYTGTYSIVSNVLTATIASVYIDGTSTAVTDHKLYPSQYVRLSTSTGAIPSGVYTVVSRPSATTFTANVIAPDSSGTMYMYPNTMRIYVFDENGTRQSQAVSWTVRGS